jgi:hypothetical protein
MKKILSILAALMICFSLSSCVTAAHAQIDDMYDSYDVNVVVTYGIPYYNADGLVLYYLYRDIFYYPFFHNNRYYLRPYRKPLPPSGARGYRPIPRDYHFGEPPHRGHGGAATPPPIKPNNDVYRVVPRTNENGHNTYRVTPNTRDGKPNIPTKPNEDVKANVKPNTQTVPNVRQNITIPNQPQRPNVNVAPTTRSNGAINSGTTVSVPTAAPNRSVSTSSAPRSSARPMSGRR